MFKDKKVGVIVPAAGKGSRFGGKECKQFLELSGKPVIVHVLEKFQNCKEVDVITIAIDKSYNEKLIQWIQDYKLDKVAKIVQGGLERQDSVRNCLKILGEFSVDLVVIHDAVRPFISNKIINLVLEAAETKGAAIAGVRVKDTIKITDENRIIQHSPPRENLWIAQTPQAFSYKILNDAFEDACKAGFIGTDDAMLIERIGGKVVIVEGDYNNIKITTPEDMEMAEYLGKKWLL